MNLPHIRSGNPLIGGWNVQEVPSTYIEMDDDDLALDMWTRTKAAAAQAARLQWY